MPILNVGITGDQIVAVSTAPLQGKEVIDVTGLIVAPGFIDTHAHGQSIPSNRCKPTTGSRRCSNSRAGILPVGEFYDNTAKEGRPLNFGVSSGWGFGRCVTLDPELAVDGKPVPTLDFMFGNLGRGTWMEAIAEGARRRR